MTDTKFEPTILEQFAIEALNEVKAWRDSDGNEGFPEETRIKVEAVLMTYEQRRIQRPLTPVAWTTQVALDCQQKLHPPFSLAFEVSAFNLWGHKGIPLYAPNYWAKKDGQS